MTPLYLVSTWKPGRWWEVKSFDKTTHRMVAVNQDGDEFIDPNFHIDMVKRCGIIHTHEKPT